MKVAASAARSRSASANTMTGVLAAELEMHALQGIRALLHDERAGRAFADKADGPDVGVFGQSLARVLTHAVDDVPHARRQSGRFGDLDQEPRGQWRKLRRLV